GGPHFTLNPAISFFVHCGTAEEVNQLWRELSHDGTVLMPLDTYPFSEHYGWLQDRFGVSWQLIVSPAASGSRIVPSFLFVGDECGNAETAMRFYASVFPEGTVGDIARYGPGYAPNPEDSVMYGEFRLLGRPFVAMDSAEDHEFSFNEGISLVVDTSTQQEIDRYWSGLSADPDAEQCGWLKDRFGVSWQIIPETEITHLLAHTDEATKKRTLEAMFRMKKIDLNELRGGHEQS
ncbi:MAG: VOC family protein, partial [Alkalispirochaeta sp.]